MKRILILTVTVTVDDSIDDKRCETISSIVKDSIETAVYKDADNLVAEIEPSLNIGVGT
jgi:hypothetical protein